MARRGLALSLVTGGLVPGGALGLTVELVPGLPDTARPDGVDFEEYPALHPLDESAPSENFIGVPVATDVVAPRIYPMLLEGIRVLDQDQGGAFVERYLRRAETLWARYQQKVWRLPYLVDYRRTPAAMLEYLRAHVGFGPKSGLPDEIASRLDEAGLRKLIKLAVPYWTRRGRRDALADSIRTLASGIRPAIDDWFSMRMLIDEAAIGVEGLPGSDPWLLYASVFGVTGSSADGEVQVVLRVPDLGGLDRQLVEDLAQLARPVGERYEIAYVDFIDTFVDGRLGLWATREGSGAVSLPADSESAPTRLPGLLFGTLTREAIDVPAAASWRRYVLTAVLGAKVSPWVMRFRVYAQDPLNYYAVDVQRDSSTGPNTVAIAKVVGGVETTLAITNAVDCTTPAARGVRIELDDAGSGNQIRVYVDNLLALEHVGDDTFSQGGVEFECIHGPVSVHRVELFQTPLALVTLPGDAT